MGGGGRSQRQMAAGLILCSSTRSHGDGDPEGIEFHPDPSMFSIVQRLLCTVGGLMFRGFVVGVIPPTSSDCSPCTLFIHHPALSLLTNYGSYCGCNDVITLPVVNYSLHVPAHSAIVELCSVLIKDAFC